MQSIAPAPVPQMHRDQDMSADNDLRAQLAAVINPSQHHLNQPPPAHGYTDVQHSSSASPHEHNIDPSIGGGPGGIMSAGAAGDSGGDDSLGDGRKGGKRELSQSKRAAQNRAAQRAFRQRKEGYIKKLEEQVRELHSLEDNYKAIQAENYSLREYIIHLQSRLIATQGDYPQPPAHINLRHPHHPPATGPHHESQVQSQGPPQHPSAPRQDHAAPVAPMSQLQASAARNIAAASLQTGKHPDDRSAAYERGDNRFKAGESNSGATDEEIIRSQLQQVGTSHDGIPTTMSM